MHHFTFNVYDDFFSHFIDSPIQKGKLKVGLDLDVRSNILVGDFFIDGCVRTPCDRCTADINLPIIAENQLVIKYGQTEELESEVMYISHDAHEISIAKPVYEFICLNIPIKRVYNCQDDDPRPCNEEALEKINESNDQVDKRGNPFEEVFSNMKKISK